MQDLPAGERRTFSALLGQKVDRSVTSAEVRSSGLYVSEAANRLSTGLVGVVCVAFGVLTSVGVVQSLGPQELLAALVYTLAVLVIQLGYFSRPGATLTRGRSVVALLGLAALSYLPALHLGSAWSGFAGFLAGSILLVLRPVVALPLFALIVLGSGLVERSFGGEALPSTFAVTYSVISTALTGLVVFGLTRLARVVRELHDARDELSRMAVAEERLRFSRDVHDLLGMSLSAITLKAELAHRLVLGEPDRARAELADVLHVSRRALGEVRMVASGAMMLSLRDEMASARSILVAAEITPVVRGVTDGLPDHVATLFATLLREAVTNVLRHAKADVCSIAVSSDGGWARLSVTNDHSGRPGGLPDDRPDTSHRGIANLRARFVERDGTLTVRCDDDEFCVTGSLPLAG